jgi:hypothetical protein
MHVNALLITTPRQEQTKLQTTLIQPKVSVHHSTFLLKMVPMHYFREPKLERDEHARLKVHVFAPGVILTSASCMIFGNAHI